MVFYAKDKQDFYDECQLELSLKLGCPVWQGFVKNEIQIISLVILRVETYGYTRGAGEPEART